MQLNRPAVNPPADGRFNAGPLCELLDTLVAMRWDLNQCLRAGQHLPSTMTAPLTRVDSELDGAINTLKKLLDDAVLFHKSKGLHGTSTQRAR
jgi:hypothetical protein